MAIKKFIFLFIILFFICPILVVAEQIDINSAVLSQLDELAGIGPVYAQRIIDARPYLSVDDLLQVKGIGPATLQKIKIQGWACVNCRTSLTAEETDQLQAQQTTETATPQNSSEAAVAEQATQTPNTQNATPTIAYSRGVYINEILPNPQGNDSTDEWIEIFNSNNYEIDLSGWKIEDIEGAKTTYNFSMGTKILSNGYLVFKRPETKITLNNSTDGLNLFWPDGKIIDSVNYNSAPKNQSYNKTALSWQWSLNLTPNSANKILRQDLNNLPKTKKSDNNIVEAGLAGISQNINANQEEIKNNNPWFLFFMALFITAASAAIVLIIKLRFSNVGKKI